MTTKNKVRTTRQRWSDVSDMRQNYRQLDAMDCGPACLKMIAGYWGCGYSLGGEDKL
ncbi:cysteine peptidase family C39 domain-containing protein [Prevotella sp. oral taxon 376]|uniref:cysteine peptidase family C39 domain-containing protein n=1 Tax=Prevotella sp. oral taxon 376 TaxID=712466 RepID=UPI001E411F5A|nr:cysteine peptidase family C39 domain-containing protein [Prevotella sp. oral taxon 376]